MSYASTTLRKKSNSTLWIILALVFGTIFLGMVLLVVGAVFMIGKARGDSDTLKSVSDRGGLFTLQVPENWNPLSGADANPDAELTMANIFGERYVQVIAEKKSELAAILPPNAKDEWLANYNEAFKSSISAQFRGSTEVVMEGSGLPAIRHEIFLKDTVEVYSWIYVVEGKDHFYQVNVWTLNSMRAENEPRLEKVAHSFREN